MNKALRTEAADPTTPPPRLKELAKQGCAREVAGNPNTPIPLLLKLAARHFESFLANPVLPLLLLEDPGFCAKIPAGALRRLLRRTELPSTFLQTLVRHPNPEVRDGARLHRALGEALPVDGLAEVFGAVCAAPSSHAQLGTFLRLGMVPVWMLEALAGSVNMALRVLAIEALRTHGSTVANEVHQLYKSAGVYPLSAENRSSMLSPNLKAEELARLARGGPWARQRAAEHPTTPPEVLRRLAADSVRGVRLAVLRNRSTPPETLWAYGGSTDVRLRLAILDNPCAPETLIEQLAADPEARVRAAALRHRLVNAAALDRLAADPEVKVRLTVARHRATGPATLAKLAHDADWTVRQRVAGRPHLPRAEIERLMDDGANIRGTLARRRDLTEDQLVRLLCDESSSVRTEASYSPSLPRQQRWSLGTMVPVPEEIRLRLADIGFRPRSRPAWKPPPPLPLRRWHPRVCRWRYHPTKEDWDVAFSAWEKNLPHEDYERFVTHPEAQVRKSAANNPATPPDLLHRLVNDPSTEVRERLAFNQHLLPESCAVLAHDSVARIRRFIAYNFCTPAEVLVLLADDPDVEVRVSVIGNRNTPEEIVRRLWHDPDPRFREHLRHNPNAPGDLLAEIYAQANANREILLHHANIPRALLEAALAGSKLSLLHAAAVNPSLTSADLSQLAASGEVTLRTFVAKHPKLPPELAAELAASGEVNALHALAGNIHTPPEVLAKLAESAPAQVRHTLAQNRALPPETLLSLIHQAGPDAAKTFAHHPGLPEEAVRLLAAQIPQDAAEWFGLLGNPAVTPALFEELYAAADATMRTKFAYVAKDHPTLQLALIRQSEAPVRMNFAYNKALSREAMLVLAADPEAQVRSTLARNPRLTPEAIRLLLEHSAKDEFSDCLVRAEVAFHQNTPHDVRLAVARAEIARYQAAGRDSPSAWVRLRRSRVGQRARAHTSAGLLLGLLLRPEMPIELFAPLLDHGDHAIDHAFLDRRDLPAEWRELIRARVQRTALRRGSLTSRLCALSAPDALVADLARAAKTGRWLERYAVAANPHTPSAVLESLSQDANRVVQEMAQSTLRAQSAALAQ